MRFSETSISYASPPLPGASARGLSCRPAYSDCFDLHPKPVDYYVFSLGRILI